MGRNFPVLYLLLFENDNSTISTTNDKGLIYLSIFLISIGLFALSLGLIAIYLEKKKRKRKRKL